uniref:Cystatin domain-containing protein n=2 Tax=Panagrellus redivivus TaxID=6233 RepID=A0A7E4VEP5_PANRE
MFLEDAHVFDNLFFNATDEDNNETGTLAPMPTSTVTPRSVDTITSTPLLFSLPTLPKLFGFGRSKWMPFGKHADFSPKLITNPTWRLKGSPPVSWTYCFPLCGSGDQALDAEDAIDNVHADAFAALSEAMTTLNLAVVTEDQVKIRYTPKNTVLEEFGDYYDKTGTRYRVVRGSVRYRYTRQSPGNFTENIEEVILPSYTF